jgi:hypothetical protein
MRIAMSPEPNGPRVGGRSRRRRWRARLFIPASLSALLGGYAGCAGSDGEDPAGPADPTGGIAAGYVADVGIENHPDVIWVERFDEADLQGVFARYTDVLNGAGMSLVPDVPPGSQSTRSLRITAVGGQNTGGHLFRPLPGTGEELYFRFYVKYGPTGTHHHSGLWTGGYNPQTAWPQGGAGQRPTGDDRFTIGFEGNGAHMDFYTYWAGMRPNPSSNPETGDNYWGNSLVNDIQAGVAAGQWICYEIRVKLNTPPTASDGELSLWRNGELIFEMGPGTPGTWVWSHFTRDAAGEPFEGFQWRTTTDLRLGFLWMTLYSTGNAAGVTSVLQFDHVVVARSYIGPMGS